MRYCMGNSTQMSLSHSLMVMGEVVPGVAYTGTMVQWFLTFIRQRPITGSGGYLAETADVL